MKLRRLLKTIGAFDVVLKHIHRRKAHRDAYRTMTREWSDLVDKANALHRVRTLCRRLERIL